MKRLILMLAAAMLLLGCKKEEVKTCYKIVYYQDWESVAPFDLLILEYNSNNEIIKNNMIYSISNGNYLYTADNNTEKCKIKMSIEYNDTNNTKDEFWVNQVYYLEKNDTTEILINGDVITSYQEP